MGTEAAAIVFLFSDIEGSTRLWEQQPVAMRDALQRHDQIARDAVVGCGGLLVKSTGDGIHAAFAEAGQALAAMLLRPVACRWRCAAACMRAPARRVTVITSAPRSTAPRASWPPRMAGRCWCHRR